MSPDLRLATHDDLDALLALYAQLNPGDLAAPRDRLAAILERIVASDEFAIVVATQQDVVVATCYLNVIPNLTRGGASYAVIENVIVDASRRGTGLGQAVVAFALAQAWRRGCYKTLLQTGSRDRAVHRFYESCGFTARDKTGYVARPPAFAGLAQR
jgi:GNAT superfamily N-acetyltransferase